MLRKQIGGLVEDTRRVRRELFASEATLLELEKIVEPTDEEIYARESLTLVVVSGIEAHVDAIAKVVDVDDQQKSSVFGDDEQFYQLLVSRRWRGVNSVDRAKEVLTDEVIHRSVGKSDLALLLSSIDHTAFQLYGSIPVTLKVLHGQELTNSVVERLMGEDFAKTLMGDHRWVEMRRRWVRLGWRSTDEHSFNHVFICAVAERVRELNDGQGDDAIHAGFSVRDTILDESLAKERPAMRAQMMEAFAKRLEREWELIPNRFGRGSGEIGSFMASGGRPVNVDFAEADKDPLKGLDDGIRNLIVRASPSTGPVVHYSDHELMRRGRDLWEQSYARGMTDEALRDGIGTLNADAPFGDEIALFAAKWAVHAFQRLMTSHTFAAALMCSDVQREVLTGIEKQWDAFLVIVPNGMLGVSRFEFSRVLVATYSYGSQIVLLTTGGPGFQPHVPFTARVTDEAPTLADLLVSDGSDLHEDAGSRRCLIMAKRLVAGLLLNLQHEPNFKVKKVEARPKKKGREAEPEHRIVTIGSPIEIDCREQVKEYIEHGKSGRKHGPPTVQVMVRGHFRRQVCGVGRMERKVIWIQPFFRGPEAALIQTRGMKV